MSNPSKTAIQVINDQISLAQANMASDNANPEFTEYQKQLNANYYRGAINYLTVVKRRIESTLTWRDM